MRYLLEKLKDLYDFDFIEVDFLVILFSNTLDY